jgi:asparagine synthase (glutamine-hydrolysing)
MRWVETVNAAQAHRGPDHAVAAQFGDFVLGNTRLAIQDPTPDGNQPYVSPDGRWVAVLNGELYNYRELINRFDLAVTSRCDGAVITPLWERFGDNALDLLRGMFALAILDTVEQRLVLARDPFGIKPLFWRKMPDGAMAFASEPRRLANLGAPAPLRPETIADFLHLGAPSRESGLYDGVAAVPANGAVAFSPGREPAETKRPLADVLAADKRRSSPSGLADTFVESLELHLRSDVPVALLLSAGVDSSVIAAGAARLGNHLTCLTVDGPGTAGESSIASATAAHYGHDHRTVPVALEPSDLDSFFAAMQRPTIDGLNTFLVCKAVKQQRIRVAISGLGGDEALGGYSTARLLPVLPALRAADRGRAGQRLLRVAAPTVARVLRRPKLSRVLEPGGPRDAHALVLVQRELFAREVVTRLCGATPTLTDTAEPVPMTETTNAPRRQLARAEIETYLTRMLLPDADAFSMCWSVELRVPFVDPIFFAHALAAPGPTRAPKRALVDGFEDPYMRRLARRRKTGFGLPMTRLMADGPLAPPCERIRATDAPIWQIIDRQAADEVLRSGPPTRWSDRWAFVVLNEWLLLMARSS